MNCDDVTLLLSDYESGRLSGAEARRVREHLAGCPACTLELERQRQLDLAIKRERAPEPGRHVHASFHAWLEAEVRAAALPVHPAREPSNIIRVSFWNRPAVVSGFVAVAACAVFAFGLLVGSHTGAGTATRTIEAQNAAELASLRDQVTSMRQAVTWSTLQQPNAGDRLQAVNAMASPDASPSVANQLLGLVAYDPNAQVRESAVHALYPHAGFQTVRTALARALVREPSPTVQLAMIDLLAATRDPEAAVALEELVHNENQNPLVREAATYALTRM